MLKDGLWAAAPAPSARHGLPPERPGWRGLEEEGRPHTPVALSHSPQHTPSSAGLNLGLRLGLAWATSGSGSRSKSGSGSSPACRTPLSHAAVLCAERRNHRFQRETKKLRPPYRRRQAGCLFNPPNHPYAPLSIHPSIHPSSTPHLLSCESAANLRRSSAARQP